MNYIVAALLIPFFLSSVMAESPGDCLNYEKVTVQLTGRIVIRTFPGPPNYESIKEGDKPERPWFLRLSKPICMNADSDGDFNMAEARVSDIHLVLHPEHFRKLRTIMKKGPVTLSGTLFHSFNAQHHAPVLMRVTGIKGP
jgi:hypothetical protein